MVIINYLLNVTIQDPKLYIDFFAYRAVFHSCNCAQGFLELTSYLNDAGVEGSEQK